MDLPKIVENPLRILRIMAENEKPTWMCNHPDAYVKDYVMKRWHCMICNKHNGAMRRISQKEILKSLTNQKGD